MPKLISPEVKEKIKKLAANNYRTQGEIAKQFGVSRPTVNRLLSKKPRVRRETRKGENCIKMDNDVVIKVKGWADQMDEAIVRDSSLGQVGLKRKDCWEYPGHENAEWRSQLLMLPHKPGERWIVAEQCKHIIGTCVMHSAALLDKVGYLYQPGLYGYDDVLISWRSNLAGFKNVFLPHIEIDHIDPGDTPYQDWKTKHSGKYSKLVSDIVDEYIAGTRTLYYEPQGERV